jgi:hypothetical protein
MIYCNGCKLTVTDHADLTAACGCALYREGDKIPKTWETDGDIDELIAAHQE